MIDFVTLVFNHYMEIDLLKLQAISFKYCESELINNINKKSFTYGRKMINLMIKNYLKSQKK